MISRDSLHLLLPTVKLRPTNTTSITYRNPLEPATALELSRSLSLPTLQSCLSAYTTLFVSPERLFLRIALWPMALETIVSLDKAIRHVWGTWRPFEYGLIAGAILVCLMAYKFYGSWILPTATTTPSAGETEQKAGNDETKIGLQPETLGQEWIEQEHKKRYEKAGSLLGYIRSFRKLIPLISLGNDRKLYLCLAITSVLFIVERAIALLIPRQLGIVTDQLTSTPHVLPYREILLWFALQLIQSNAGLRLLRSRLDSQLSQFWNQQIHQAAFKHIMNLSIDFHNDKDSAELIQAVRESSTVAQLLQTVYCDILPQFVDMVCGLVYLCSLFGPVAAVIALTGGILYSWISSKMTEYTRELESKCHALMDEMLSNTNQALSGWQTAASFNRIDHEVEKVGKAMTTLAEARLKVDRKQEFGGGAENLVTTLAFFVIISVAVGNINLGNTDVSSFVILISYWDVMVSPLTASTWYFRFIKDQLLSVERLLMLLETEPSVVDAPDARPLEVSDGKISFDKVNFSYDIRKATLKDITFTAKPGQTIALVGETGAGKSTILKLLYRFYNVNSGSISIDDQDISKVTLSSLREALGIVDQQPYLFNKSIVENLRYGRLDATDEEIYAACKAAAVHDKILTFPDGYSSVVGNRGLKLSGGELQRIAIARVLLKNPKIVLLDEATSSVDTDTEVLIQEAIARLTKERTTFVIAHRLSTIVNADLVLVFRDGNIIQSGTHEELSRKGGKYRSLWEKQIHIGTDKVDNKGAAGDTTGSVDLKVAADTATSAQPTDLLGVNIDEITAEHAEEQDVTHFVHVAEHSVEPGEGEDVTGTDHSEAQVMRRRTPTSRPGISFGTDGAMDYDTMTPPPTPPPGLIAHPPRVDSGLELMETDSRMARELLKKRAEAWLVSDYENVLQKVDKIHHNRE